MEALESVLAFLGSSLCHQLAERSYSIDGFQMPLCARCLGLHVGFLLSTIAILVQRDKAPSGLPGTRSLAVLGSAMALAVADVALSYVGVIDTDNARRAVTGALFGASLAFILLPLTRAALDSSGVVGRSMGRPHDWLSLSIVAVTASALVMSAESSEALFYSLAVVGIAGVFVTAGSLILVLLLLLSEGRDWNRAMRLAAAAVITPVFLLALAALHAILE